MGAPLSPVIADLFMKDLEEKIFATCPKHCERPRIWKRFVDDVVSVIHKEHQHLFLTHLNK